MSSARFPFHIRAYKLSRFMAKIEDALGFMARDDLGWDDDEVLDEVRHEVHDERHEVHDERGLSPSTSSSSSSSMTPHYWDSKSKVIVKASTTPCRTSCTGARSSRSCPTATRRCARTGMTGTGHTNKAQFYAPGVAAPGLSRPTLGGCALVHHGRP